ncbi:MAG: fluoride efflux transporter CrcB [Porticoccus sp.]|nr:fluoride efflux transporter CrcB [Porticoccus sp.]
MQWLAVALGGALGAVGRFAVNSAVFPIFGGRLPMGTLVVNVLGSILMGFFYVLIIERGVLPAELRNFLMVGFLGAFTTFSTFSLDTLALWQNGHLALAAAYVALNVVLCLAGTLGAIVVTRLL